MCETKAGLFEIAADRGATCTCSENATSVACDDTSCESCNLDGTLCAINTNYGYTFDDETGDIATFRNTLQYTLGRNETITFIQNKTASAGCQVSVNSEQCRECGNSICRSGFQGFSIICDNLEGGGFSFNSCDETFEVGFLEVFFLFDQSLVSGCPVLLE